VALEKALALNPKLVDQAVKDNDLEQLRGDSQFDRLIQEARP
jgi:hypothetical protein